MPDRTTLYDRDGNEFTTGNALEIARLRSRGYSETRRSAEQPDDFTAQQFHPADAKVDEVLDYLRHNPQDAGRVISEEKATAKPRKTIVEFDVLRDTGAERSEAPDGVGGDPAGVPDPGAPVGPDGAPAV